MGGILSDLFPDNYATFTIFGMMIPEEETPVKKSNFFCRTRRESIGNLAVFVPSQKKNR